MKTTPLTAFASISALAALSAIAWLPAAAFAQKFEAQTIDAKVAIGYGLAIGDVDGDGKPDVLLADKREIVWYENPEWKRHVMAKNLTTLDNVCIAARDLDGDGKVEVACGAMWNPGETDDPAKSGSLHYLIRPDGDPRGAWQPVRIQPHDPTVHRMHWARLGDGKWGLAVAPLHGRGNRGGKGENGARLQVYPLPADPADGSAWKPATLSERMHATHNFDVIPAESGAEAFALAGAEGIQRVKADAGAPQDALWINAAQHGSPGAGEVRLGPSEGDVCAIEPMHGNELVVYSPADGGGWKRSVLIDSMNQGHALACGDLYGDGAQEIVAGWRNPDADGKVGIRIFSRDGDGWKAYRLDDNQMACEDLKLADLNGDGRLDVIAAGRATNNVVIYWNKG